MPASQMPPGPGVDAQGRAVKDPTENVRELVTEALRRQDDLRDKDALHVRQILKLRTDRNDDLRASEGRHLREIGNLRAEHNKELRNAESERINAIRAVDVAAVAAAAQVSATQATTLAGQVNTSAEAMRIQVAAAAQAATVGLSAALEPIQKDIAELRKAQYEAQGQKAQVIETREGASDWRPIMDAIAELKRGQYEAQGQQQHVVETRAKSSSTGMWIGVGVAALVGLSSVFLAAIGVVITLALRQ